MGFPRRAPISIGTILGMTATKTDPSLALPSRGGDLALPLLGEGSARFTLKRWREVGLMFNGDCHLNPIEVRTSGNDCHKN